MKNPSIFPAERPALVPSLEHRFANLWHLWDFIEAPSPLRGQRPAWKRVTKYLLSANLLLNRWESSEKLIGVSFDKETCYCLLDIDRGSRYHPYNDEATFQQLLELLETIGLVRLLIVRSSESGGLHIYAPLPEAVSTWKLANLLANTCHQAELDVRGGQLELFPNVKTWVPEGGGFSHYQAHRLPLQQGSVLLNNDMLPEGADLNRFMTQWQWCAEAQDMERFRAALATTKSHRNNQVPKGTALQYLKDLQASIARGWTDFSQTNDLLSRIARKGYIFLHKTGKALVDYMVFIAKKLPGYEAFCRHQNDLVKRCRDWARAIEKSPKYYPYNVKEGSANVTRAERPLKAPLNSERKANALSRLKEIVARLEADGILKPQITPRAKQLASLGFSQETLYKPEYKIFWHPNYYQSSVIVEPAIDSAISESLPPEAPPLEIPKKQGITDNNLRSVSEPEGLKKIERTPPRGVVGGKETAQLDSESTHADPDLLLCELSALAGWRGYEVFKRLITRTSPEKVKLTIASFKEQNAKNTIANPVAWLATSLREGWTPNHLLSKSKSASQPVMISLPSDPRLAIEDKDIESDNVSSVLMPDWFREQIRSFRNEVNLDGGDE